MFADQTITQEKQNVNPDFLQIKDVLYQRPRRNRKINSIRKLIQEHRLHPSQLVAPLFVMEGESSLQSISSIPGASRMSLDILLKEIEELCRLGIYAVDLFPVIPLDKKDSLGSEAIREGNLMEKSIRAIKGHFPEVCVMADVALDPYTDHGHDGILNENGYVMNDVSLRIFGDMALLYASAGVDMIAPSDMMDGRVAYLRHILDQFGYTEVGILSYAAKYASHLYGPFRDALDSFTKIGDKKSYQLNSANRREALREVCLDEQEGADMLLIKPALPYLDVILEARAITKLPLGAYHVSGEYAMVMAAAEKGWINADKVIMECLFSIKRAGADFIFTYAAKRAAQLIHRGFEI